MQIIRKEGKSLKRLQFDIPDFIADMLEALKIKYQLSYREIIYRAIEHLYKDMDSISSR